MQAPVVTSATSPFTVVINDGKFAGKVPCQERFIEAIETLLLQSNLAISGTTTLTITKVDENLSRPIGKFHIYRKVNSDHIDIAIRPRQFDAYVHFEGQIRAFGTAITEVVRILQETASLVTTPPVPQGKVYSFQFKILKVFLERLLLSEKLLPSGYITLQEMVTNLKRFAWDTPIEAVTLLSCLQAPEWEPYIQLKRVNGYLWQIRWKRDDGEPVILTTKEYNAAARLVATHGNLPFKVTGYGGAAGSLKDITTVRALCQKKVIQDLGENMGQITLSSCVVFNGGSKERGVVKSLLQTDAINDALPLSPPKKKPQATVTKAPKTQKTTRPPQKAESDLQKQAIRAVYELVEQTRASFNKELNELKKRHFDNEQYRSAVHFLETYGTPVESL